MESFELFLASKFGLYLVEPLDFLESLAGLGTFSVLLSGPDPPYFLENPSLFLF